MKQQIFPHNGNASVVHCVHVSRRKKHARNSWKDPSSSSPAPPTSTSVSSNSADFSCCETRLLSVRTLFDCLVSLLLRLLAYTSSDCDLEMTLEDTLLCVLKLCCSITVSQRTPLALLEMQFASLQSTTAFCLMR